MSQTELLQLVVDMFFSAGVLGIFVGVLYAFWGNGR